MPTRASARHRAAIRPKTPLTGLAATLASGTTGRRSMMIAASSGLILAGGLPAASATPVADLLPVKAAQSAEPEQDVQQPKAAPEVTVPADAPVSFAGTALTTATPPPPPPPAPVAAAQPPTQERASRSEQRQSLAAPARSIVATPAAASSGGHGGSALAIASRYVGTMYRYGGTTPAGFDCSGYTQYVYRQMGINIPRTSGAQAAAGRRIPASQARPGDLVYTPGHVGIYAGGNMMYDSPHSGAAVAKRAMWFTPQFIRFG